MNNKYSDEYFSFVTFKMSKIYAYITGGSNKYSVDIKISYILSNRKVHGFEIKYRFEVLGGTRWHIMNTLTRGACIIECIVE